MHQHWHALDGYGSSYSNKLLNSEDGPIQWIDFRFTSELVQVFLLFLLIECHSVKYSLLFIMLMLYSFWNISSMLETGERKRVGHLVDSYIKNGR